MADNGDSGSCSDVMYPATCWDRLGDILDRIKTMSDFAAVKKYQLAPNPVVRVGDEIITLPLNDHGVKSIKKVGRQAPFGKGERTVIDKTIRRTWELNTDECGIVNPAWASFLQTITQEVCFDNLGIKGTICTKFHKLLLYEPGSFFKAHKDSQKAKGMIATLVICLPSEHEGGEVHLSHAGQHRRFNTSESSLFDTTVLAWYSDVTHEVKKIVSGHRLVLTYNVILESGSMTSPSMFDQQLDTVKNALTQCRLNGLHPLMKIYPLDHKYSRAGLSLRALKGRDRAVCESLYRLCSQQGFYLLLGNMKKEHSRNPDDYYDNDDEEDGEVDLSLDVINRPDGAELANGIFFEEDELIRDPYGNRDEDSFEESKHLGNEESPEIFKYYDSAAIICSKSDMAKYGTSRWNVKLENIVVMIMKDIEENPNAIGAPGTSLATLEKIVYHTDTQSLRMMIKWAWAHDYRSLYIKCITFSVGSSVNGTCCHKVSMMTVAEIINADISDAKYKTAVQWDKYLGCAIDCIQSLSTLAECLTLVEDAIIDSLKPAFSTWKFAVQKNRFNSKECLGEEDKGFIFSKLDNSDWFTDCLVPALVERGNKALITCVVIRLLRNKPEATQTNATNAASKILQSTCSKVALDPSLDFEGGYSFEHTPASQFLKLLERSLEHGLKFIAGRLLDDTWANINAYHKDADSTLLGMVECFLKRLGQLLFDYKVPYLDSARQLSASLIRRYVYVDVLSYPKQLPGWSCRPRGCGCEQCQKLDDFLRAEDLSTCDFHCEKGSYHLEQRLPRSTFDYDRYNKFGILRVYKLQGKEFSNDLEEYRRRVKELEKDLQRFQHKHVKELLGDADYRELIMLDGLKNSEGAKELATAVTTAQPSLPPNLSFRQKIALCRPPPVEFLRPSVYEPLPSEAPPGPSCGPETKRQKK